MLNLDVSMQSLLLQKTHCFATCWKVERTDGTTLYFTNHDHKLDLNDGNTYTPTGGFDASARQLTSGLDAPNLELIGVLSGNGITHADLKAGRYREAKITEYLVNWRYPWAGEFVSNTYWVVETRFTGEHWEVRLEGIPGLLKHSVGGVYNRACRHELGGTACGVTMSGYKESKTVTQIDTARRIFRCAGIGDADDYYNYGYVEFTSGDNNGLQGEIKDWTLVNNIIELQLETPFDIDVGDTFDMWPGCDKLQDTCKTKFSNFDNYGGFPFMPGSDKVSKTPKAK